LIYDNISTSYALNLPADYYRNQIKESLPDTDKIAYYIRPHHVESLTQH